MNNKKIYIEAGANDGRFQARSLSFRNDNDYLGILVECDPDSYRACVANTKESNCEVYHAALVSFDFEGFEIEMGKSNFHSAMNSIVMPSSLSFTSKIKVPARTLQSILDEKNISVVDYLFLDVEGYEKNVIEGIDFSKTKFKHIEIECHTTFINLTFEEEKQMYLDYFSQIGYCLKEVINDGGNPKLVFVED